MSFISELPLAAKIAGGAALLAGAGLTLAACSKDVGTVTGEDKYDVAVGSHIGIGTCYDDASTDYYDEYGGYQGTDYSSTSYACPKEYTDYETRTQDAQFSLKTDGRVGQESPDLATALQSGLPELERKREDGVIMRTDKGYEVREVHSNADGAYYPETAVLSDPNAIAYVNYDASGLSDEILGRHISDSEAKALDAATK